MAPRKKVGSSSAEGSSSASTLPADHSAAAPNSLSIETTALPMEAAAYDPVQINNYNLTELKNTLDDALKRCLSRPDSYTQVHVHTDVRLALGWLSVLVAAGTGLYSWKISFEEGKPVVWVGVLLYLALSSAQMAYAYFVEGSVVFVGKRKTLAKRIETARLMVESRTTRPKPESPAPKSAPVTTLSTVYNRLTSPYLPPHYYVTLNYSLTASAGKSLVRRGKVEDERCYADFFDEKGNLDEARFVSWVSALVAKVESE